MENAGGKIIKGINMTTSKNFDTQVKDLSPVYIRNFESLIGFTKKTKGKKFAKALKEEYPADIKEKIASGKITVRNLDKDPIKSKPFKNDTFFTVKEIAKYCWENSTKIQGRFADEKALLSTLKTNKQFRHLCNDKMIEKIGKNKSALYSKKEEKVEVDADKLAKHFFNNPKYPMFNDIKRIEDLRRMIAKNPDQAKKLVMIMNNEKKGK